MKIFLDTCVLVEPVVKGEDAEIAKEILNKDCEKGTSLFCLLEMRAVLTKKYMHSPDVVNEVLQWIKEELDILIVEVPDLESMYENHSDHLLEGADTIVYETAEETDAIPITFDSELTENGFEHPENMI